MEVLVEWLLKNKLTAVVAAIGLVLVLGGGVWWWRERQPVDVQILGADDQRSKIEDRKIQVDVQGEVVKPGVYRLDSDARIKDVITAAGGLAAKADRIWVARFVNMAQKVVDGSKIYIPAEHPAGISNDQFSISNDGASGGFININTALVGELDTLPGIGMTRAKAIVAGRPYGAIEELISKKILPQSVFDKIKDKMSVY